MKKKKTGRRVLSFLLTLAMVVGLLSGMSLTAYAATDKYTNLIPTSSDIDLSDKQVNFNGYKWYIIEYNSTANNAGTVTLLAADTSFGNALFDDGTNVYSNSAIKRTFDTYTDSGTFKDVAEAIINTSNGRLYLLSSEEAQNLPSEVLKANFTGGDSSSGEWWLRTAVLSGGHVAIVKGTDGSLSDAIPTYDYGVRPALQLDLSKVTFDSATNTFSVGTVSKDPVSYMAWDETEKKLVEKTGDEACKEYEVVTAETTTWGTAGQTTWYVVKEDVTISSEEDEYDIKDEVVKLEGNVNLILCDGACLTVSSGSLKGIYVGGYSLTIYAQSTGASMGELKVNTKSDSIRSHRGDVSIIGGSVDAHGEIKAVYGTVNISGGSVTVTVTDDVQNAICADGRITINGGTVKATGGFDSAISTSTGITISGGTVTATTPVEGAAGINAGDYSNDVTISGGEFTAIGARGSIDYAKVKNAIAGTGWTNTEGTEGKADIAISETGQKLSSYKKVQFPAAAKATPVIGDFIFTAPTNLAYNGTAKSANVVAKDGINGMGDVTVKYYSDEDCTDEVECPTNAGTYYVGITVAEGDNYTATTSVLHDSSWKFSISKQDAPVSLNADQKPTANTGLTYTGNEQELVTASTELPVGYIEMQYALGTKDAATQPYTTSIPTATNAGTYYVWYKVVGDNNHLDSDAGYVTVTIAAADSLDSRSGGSSDNTNTNIASLVLIKASKSGVVLSSKIVSKKGVAAKYNKKSVSVAKALKGHKVVKAKGVKLSKLKKLSKMVRIYRKKKKSSKNTKVTLKVSNLSKKAKKVYALHYSAKAKKWYITKLTINRKKKTVTGKWNRLGTTALVYTA
ncbi:DUF6273 domain-containing protein [Kandleria vitulina]|uniref:DUF6273 domain-containing protein n=1 Tax=Kandleria vitulina TaxID=1630 RepID=UPI000490E8BE|nr:DUF6273 domain-containing protein [Kandleria vitulina]